MSDLELSPETHLGEGVYVSYRGGQLWLREHSEDGDDMVALGRVQWLALRVFVEKVAVETHDDSVGGGNKKLHT